MFQTIFSQAMLVDGLQKSRTKFAMNQKRSVHHRPSHPFHFWRNRLDPVVSVVHPLCPL